MLIMLKAPHHLLFSVSAVFSLCIFYRNGSNSPCRYAPGSAKANCDYVCQEAAGSTLLGCSTLAQATQNFRQDSATLNFTSELEDHHPHPSPLPICLSTFHRPSI